MFVFKDFQGSSHVNTKWNNSTKAELQIHVVDDYQNTYGQRGRTKTKHGTNDHRSPQVFKT